MKTALLSRREKLLLTLLSSTLLFSFSFSYGAVNSNKVDAIMEMITKGGANFSDIPVAGQTKSERTQYYEKVDAGLGDAVEMLAVVRNNIRSLMGLSPAYTADEVVGGIISGVLGGTTGGNTGGNTSGETNTSIMSLCSSDTTVETLTWPSDVTTTMEVTDTKSKVFKVVVPNGGTNMNISYPSISTNGYSRTIPKLYYTVSQKKACAYGDTSLGWSNTLQGGGTLNFSVVSTVTTAPYTSTPKLSPGVWYISFKSQQPLTGDVDPKSKFNIFMEGGITGGDNPASNSRWGSASSISCPTSLSALRSSNSSTYDSSSNTSGYQYANVGSSTNPLYINIKDYTNTSDLSLPSSCTPGKKWITKSGTNSCSIFSCVGTVTTPPTIPPIPGSSDLGIFANDPIPAPCPANTKLMNEILISGAPTSGAWIRRPWYQKGTLNGVNHVYRLTVYNPDTSIVGNKGDIRFSDTGQANAVAVKISPYPCDFPEVATDGYSIKNASACTSGDFSIGGSVSFDYEENKASGRVCHLKKGVTYYANVRSTDFPTNPGGTPTGYGGGYDLAMYGKLEKDSLAMYGIYDTFQKWEPQQNRNLSTEGNISSQDPETLRQKVVNDYKTTGKNSEKLTIPLFTNTIKPLDKTVSNAGCEIHVDSNVHASVTKFSRVVADMTSPANIYYVGGVTVRQAADFPLCPSGLSVGTYTSKMYALNESITELLATSNYPNGLCRYNDTKVMGMTMPVECKQLCERTLGGSFANGWCEPTPGGLFE